MSGKLIAYVLSLFTFFYILLASITFFLYLSSEERVHDICYDAAETISTKGMLSGELYMYLEDQLSVYGEYDIRVTLEQANPNSTSTFFYGAEQIKDKPLKQGDKLILTAVDTNPSLFEKITGAGLRTAAVKTAVII